ncbi:MAG: extracellular solute-binding protein, partial [Thermoproteota archaeon]|nr:extracellular solute-binding protein [Thermoproteota archaeon]
MTRKGWQLFKMSRHYLPKMAPVMVALLTIMITLPLLQPALSTADLPSSSDFTIYDENNNNTISETHLSSNESSSTSTNPTNTITLRGLFTDLGDPGRWNDLLQPALDELNRRHPGMNIQIEYSDFPYNETRNELLDGLSRGDSVDIISVDQIWLGEFAEMGLLRNLTDDFQEWNGISNLYESNLDGCIYNNTVYGLWLWTDIRGIWYWKDMLQEAGVDPESLKTWDGYISAAVQLDNFFKEDDNVIQGIHLLGASHDLDMWYPYLWMLGGEILELREGHPTKGVYWFPSYNSSEGVRAMGFLKQQVDAGIEPQMEHHWGGEFANRSFAVMLEGSWMPGEFPRESWST